MRKKLIALLMAALMLLSLAAACGNQPTETPTPDPAPPPSTDPIPAPAPSTDPTPAPSEPVKDEKYGGDLIVVNNAVSNTMDPHFVMEIFGNYIWMQHVFEGVITQSEGGIVYPLICDHELSEDGLTLKLTVREYYFSNGERVTPEDIVASLNRAASIDGSFAENYWNYVADTKIEGDTITYTFSRLVTTLLDELSSGTGCYIIPKEICDKWGENPITDMADAIGTGPYKLKDYNPDVEVVVERNESYVPTMNDCSGLAGPRMAYADTIAFAVNTDNTSTAAGMISGDYHVGGIMSSMRPLAEQLGLKLNLLANQWTQAIFFNLHESNADSPVQDVNVRKAIRAVLDCDALMITIMQTDDPNRITMDPSPIIASNTDYYNTIIADTEWNIKDKELAKQYLAASDYNGEEITWLCYSGSGYYRAAVAAIPLFEEIGLNVTMQVVDSGSHAALRIDPTNGHDIGCWETQKAISNPITQNNFILGTNGGWWTNAKKDELINIMNTTPTGSAASVQAYKDFCTLVTEEVPWIAFGHQKTSTYSQPNVELNYNGIYAYYWNTYFID